MSKKNEKSTPKSTKAAKKNVDAPAPDAISSSGLDSATTTTQEKNPMTLTFSKLDKRGRNAIYLGAAVSLRIPVGAFPDKTPPASFEVTDGAMAATRAAKVKIVETKEERKARLAALPKKTLAEKIAAQEKRLAELKAKSDKAAADQPSI